MCRGCRERFPRHRFQRKPLVSDPGMHRGTCVTCVPWCMSGSLTRGEGENIPEITGACATRNCAYLTRCPCQPFIFVYEKPSQFPTSEPLPVLLSWYPVTSLLGKLIGHRWSPHKGPVMRSFDVVFVSNMNRSNCRWFKTLCRYTFVSEFYVAESWGMGNIPSISARL